jgi:predicted nucleic acid-binding protein
MPTEADMIAVYWDTSAVLSALFADQHSPCAQDWAKRAGFHFLSTLAYAETCAVIARIGRERMLADILVEAALVAFLEGPWRRVISQPEWNLMRGLSKKWPLRGADLWHLAMAKSLQIQMPELVLLTFDNKLAVAAHGENLRA